MKVKILIRIAIIVIEMLLNQKEKSLDKTAVEKIKKIIK
jgi:hypothetical protein